MGKINLIIVLAIIICTGCVSTTANEKVLTISSVSELVDSGASFYPQTRDEALNLFYPVLDAIRAGVYSNADMTQSPGPVSWNDSGIDINGTLAASMTQHSGDYKINTTYDSVLYLSEDMKVSGYFNKGILSCFSSDTNEWGDIQISGEIFFDMNQSQNVGKVVGNTLKDESFTVSGKGEVLMKSLFSLKRVRDGLGAKFELYYTYNDEYHDEGLTSEEMSNYVVGTMELKVYDDSNELIGIFDLTGSEE